MGAAVSIFYFESSVKCGFSEKEKVTE